MRTLRLAVAVATATLLATPAPVVAQSPLTFESVPVNAAGFNPTPFTALGEYRFEGWGVLAQGSTFGTGTNAVSGTRFAYGFAQQPQFIYRDDPAHFDLVDAWLSFRTVDGNVAPATITVRGFRGADELFVRAVTLSNAAERITFDWRGLTEVAFESESLNDARSAVLAMDDVTVTTTTPEPATVALLGLGGVALVGVRVVRRRSHV